MLGIIGAMDEEVSKLKEKMTDVEIKKKASMDFYRGKLMGKDVVVVRSGIGKLFFVYPNPYIAQFMPPWTGLW